MIYFWLTFENFHLEKVDFNIKRVFYEKDAPTLPYVKNQIIQVARFLYQVQADSQKYRQMLKFFYFHIQW
jgi:hypothetical protein